MISRHELEYMAHKSRDEDKKGILKYYISIIKNPEIKMSIVKITNKKMGFLVSPTSNEELPTNIQRYEWRFNGGASPKA